MSVKKTVQTRNAAGQQARDALRRRGEEIKAGFEQRGITIKQWAEEAGYPYQAVERVLNGVSRARYGQGHEIAVKLGMKPGVSLVAAE